MYKNLVVVAILKSFWQKEQDPDPELDPDPFFVADPDSGSSGFFTLDMGSSLEKFEYGINILDPHTG